MEFDLFDTVSSRELYYSALKQKILDTNQKSAEHGLALTDKDADMLVLSNSENLQVQQRVEIGESIVTKLIRKFMYSRYISQLEYADTVAALLEIFYESKEESNDALTDDEVLDIMFYYFENVSEGSIELLQTRDMDYLCRKIRNKALNLTDEEGD